MWNIAHWLCLKTQWYPYIVSTVDNISFAFLELSGAFGTFRWINMIPTKCCLGRHLTRLWDTSLSVSQMKWSNRFSSHYLLMRLSLHVLSVHLHHSVAGLETGQVRGGSRLDLADVLRSSVAFTVQMKSVPAVSFSQITEPWTQLPLQNLSLQGVRHIQLQSC